MTSDDKRLALLGSARGLSEAAAARYGDDQPTRSSRWAHTTAGSGVLPLPITRRACRAAADVCARCLTTLCPADPLRRPLLLGPRRIGLNIGSLPILLNLLADNHLAHHHHPLPGDAVEAVGDLGSGYPRARSSIASWPTRRARRRPEPLLCEGVSVVRGRGWRARGDGVDAPSMGGQVSVQETSPPSCESIGACVLFALDARSIREEL